MTYQSTWRRAYAGAKRALGAAVVAGFMAGFMAGPSHASTVVFGFGPFSLFLGAGPHLLSIDDDYNITVQTDEVTGTAYIGFESTEPLQTVSTTVMNPQGGGFDFVQAGWFTDKDDLSTGAFQEVPQTGHLSLTTTFAVANLVMWLIFDWDGINPSKEGGKVTLDSNLSATTVVPLPPGLVLFLSGLIGIGVLGRYKAKRRREEPATA